MHVLWRKTKEKRHTYMCSKRLSLFTKTTSATNTREKIKIIPDNRKNGRKTTGLLLPHSLSCSMHTNLSQQALKGCLLLLHMKRTLFVFLYLKSSYYENRSLQDTCLYEVFFFFLVHRTRIKNTVTCFGNIFYYLQGIVLGKHSS